MNLPTIKSLALASTVIGITLLGMRPAAAELQVYLSSPNSITSEFSNTTVETFEGIANATYNTNLVGAIGTYSLSNNSKLKVQADDSYGSGSKYATFGAQSGTSGPVTLTFNEKQAYFGFEWQAGDNNNGLSFYDGDTLLGRFSTKSIVTLLSGQTVNTVEGGTYETSLFKGKPGSRSTNNGEPYAFVNIINTTGLFDRVVFDNSGTTGTGFETDNHTVRKTAPTPLGTFVSVGNVPSVPETSSLLLMGTAAIGAITLVRRKK